MRTIKVRESATECEIDVMPYAPSKIFLWVSAVALFVLPAAFLFSALLPVGIPTGALAAFWVSYSIALIILLIGWIAALYYFLNHDAAHLLVNKSLTELQLDKRSWVSVEASEQIPLSAIRKVWFEVYFDPVVMWNGKYWVGLDLEGNDRNRIIASNLNEGEKQSLTLALERAIGVKAELKPVWEVIEAGPPTVIAIFARGKGLKQAYRITIDRNANLLTIINSRNKEKIIPLTTVRQVWSQVSIYTAVGTGDDASCDVGLDYYGGKDTRIASSDGYQPRYDDSMHSLAQTLAGAIGVKHVVREVKRETQQMM